MAKAGGTFKTLQADTLCSKLVREVVLRSPLSFAEIDEVIRQRRPAIHAANIARVIALQAGFSEATPAMTVHRNCAAGMESIDAMDILDGSAISRGPKNLMAHAYFGAPIAITVEGANIMTRTLIQFGQGVIRCHPYAFAEIW